MLIWTKSLWNLQILEIFYGTYMSTEVAYYTYIYAKVDKEHYDQVTSHTRAAILCGRFVAGTLGQILIYLKLMNYLELNYITLAGTLKTLSFLIILIVIIDRIKKNVLFMQLKYVQHCGLFHYHQFNVVYIFIETMEII